MINIHPSLLPKYRGASPIESAILAGDDETGVTLMQIDAGMDSGPIYTDYHVQLTGIETRLSLYEQLAEAGAELLAAEFEAIANGTLVPIPQDHSKATVSAKIAKANGRLDWTKPADVLEREVRGYLGWPGSSTTIAGVDAIITAAHVGPASGQQGLAYRTAMGELAVFASEASLIIDMIKPVGKREMTAEQFMHGRQIPTA